MIDTVILTIPRGSYKINSKMFTPNADILKGPGQYLVKCVSNPTSDEKKKGIYRPRLTLMKRMTRKGDEIPLKIEFSVPKILYGNNVDEVQESDFEAVVEELHNGIRAKGAFVSKGVLKTAAVSAFHPSKNVELKDGYTSSFVITELHKINVSKKMDLNKDSFRNHGHSLQFYTNSHSLVLYDKIQDLKKPTKRAIDKDQNPLQLSLFETLTKKKKKEILRIEARLAKKVKMNTVLKKFSYKENPALQDIFKKDLCQKILRDYWEELIADKNLFLFEVQNNPKKTLEKIYMNNQKIKPKQALYLVGLWVLSKEGIRDTRTVIEQYAHKRTWYRISDDLLLLDKISSKMYHAWINQINDCLVTFKPFRVSTK